MQKGEPRIFLDLLGFPFKQRVGLRGSFAAGALLEVGGICLGALGPYLLKCLVDTLSGTSPTAGPLLGLVVVFVVAWSGTTVISTWRTVYSTRIISAINKDLSIKILEGSLPAATAGHDGDSGRILGLLERLPFSLQIVVDGLIWRAFPVVLQVGLSLALVAGLIPFRYVLVLSILFFGFVAATWLGVSWHQRVSKRANEAASRTSHGLGDVLRNARRVVLNGALPLEVKRMGDAFDHKQLAEQAVAWSLVKLSSLQYGVVGVGLFILLAMGASDVLAHKMSVGDFVLLQAYAFRLALPLSSFGIILSQSGVAIANIREITEHLPVPETPEAPKPLLPGPAHIRLGGVGFRYEDGLAGVSEVGIDFPAGSFTVIAGSNGSGKSTLAHLIAGILDPMDGTVSVNGINVAEIPKSERHRYILYVPQFIGLFDRTLAENAFYPPTDQSEADLANLLADWRFYDSGRVIDFGVKVGEQGERLSGGQIQKLELARLAGVRVPAMILDESTSSLDPRSEIDIVTFLTKHFGAKTTLIVISHRPALAELADQVVFMEAGKVVAVGGHAALIETVPGYAELWNIAGVPG